MTLDPESVEKAARAMKAAYLEGHTPLDVTTAALTAYFSHLRESGKMRVAGHGTTASCGKQERTPHSLPMASPPSSSEQRKSNAMWVWYTWVQYDDGDEEFRVIVAKFCQMHCVYNESCMMIPGTYAQMHEDYS